MISKPAMFMRTKPMRRSDPKRGSAGLLVSQRSTLTLFLLPALLVLAALTLFPFFHAIFISFTGLEIAHPQRGMPFVGLANYKELITSDRFWNSVKVTSIFVVTASVVEMLLGFSLAYLIRNNFHGRKVVVSLFIAPLVIPPIVAGLMWRFMYDDAIGIINFLLRQLGLRPQPWLGSSAFALPAVIVTDIWQWTPFILLVLLAGFQSLPEEPFEAAATDGATGWQVLRFITLPMLRNVILVAFLLRIIELFRTFDTIFIMTQGGPGISTESMYFRNYLLGFSFFATSRASAFSIVLMFVVIFICSRLIKLLGAKES